MESAFLDAVADRVVVYDGATGTWLQTQDLDLDDYGGPAFEGCTDILGVTRPDVVKALHTAYLEVGADVIETNTFGAFAVPLGEYDIADRAHEVALANARIARSVADEFSTPDKPRFVAGSLGPGTKAPSLGQIRFAALRDSYETAARALLEGGVDLFILETHFDLLALKAAVIGARRAMAAEGREVPIQAQVTMELTGRMLLGTEIGAALAAIDPLDIDIIGINCATGPAEMSEHLRHLSQHARMPISCLPNAGLPSVVDGAMHYDLTAEELRDHQRRFVNDMGVQVIGGCCGTTPEFIQLLAEMAPSLTPATRTPEHESSVTSIYSAVPLHQDASFLMIGERTNANGSKKFREAMLEGDWDTCSAMANAQIKEGAHVLDVCADYVGRDGTADMDELASRFATQANAPLVLDSTEPEVMEAGLQWVGGRAILNSANLEDGEEEGNRLDRVFRLAKEYGAAVICLLIDEEGQARDVEWKMRVARRIVDLAVNRYGLEEGDLIFDALTFPLSTGDDDLRKDAMATMDAIKQIKEEFPGVFTTLGVSNVSFGLNPAARHVLNSVFIHECTQVGLDSAIVHASKILPLSRIPDEQRDVALDLIYDRRGTEGLLSDGQADYDPLHKMLDVFADVKAQAVEKEDRSDWPIEKRLSQRIIDGERDGLTDELDEAMAGGLSALTIVNEVLLAGMKVVGDLFGKGEMQLPFVLQSAETMKAAVAYLEPHMERVEGDTGKGRIVLATVKGDVHDIGKNLVDIILTNNGYKVINLGIKVPLAQIVEAAVSHKAHAIGMSGLLVKSTVVMRENLEEMSRQGIDLPVLLGGAALTRNYVEDDCVKAYACGRVVYARDAFDGLHLMDKVMGNDFDGYLGAVQSKRAGKSKNEKRVLGQADPRGFAPVDVNYAQGRRRRVAAESSPPTPPFWGARVMEAAPKALVPFINERSLYQFQWGFRKAGRSLDDFLGWAKQELRPVLKRMLTLADEQKILRPQAIYGYWKCAGQGNDLVLFEEDGITEVCRFALPRQPKEDGECIADFVTDIEDGRDVIGLQVVTVGQKASDIAREWFEENRYQDYLYLHGLSVEMAEAMAEYVHKRIRAELGYAAEDDRDIEKMLSQGYRGGRYSFGYPACPRLEDQEPLLKLLKAERIGVTISDEWQLHPEQSTSAIVLHHPRAKYFSV